MVALLATATVVLNTRFDAPPRFDGAGYAVLARSLLIRHDYRALDHPDQPRHAHFPPGYPIALATWWRLVGESATSAHVFSCACTIAATLAGWLWFRRLYRPRVAWALGMALAVNWSWGRIGGTIQSEPLYLLLAGLVLLTATRRHPVVLGALLGGCILTRHVGIGLALAVGLDLLWRRRTLDAITAGLVALAVVAPWIAWLATVRHETQVGLLPTTGVLDQAAANALFYLRRIPDQVTGPLVEVGTVFRPAWRVPVTALAALATGLVCWGWSKSLRTSRRRLAGLVPLATLPLLLIWPFTEAGRFLIPLVPFVLVGAVEGTSALLAWGQARRPRAWAAVLVLVATLPYATYAIATGRAAAAERRHADFDAACAWIAEHGDRVGPVLTRQPGEVYWLTGRPALVPPGDNPGSIARAIQAHGVAYLLVDDERYALAPSSPLGRFARQAPGLRPVWSRGRVAVFARQGFGPSNVSRP